MDATIWKMLSEEEKQLFVGVMRLCEGHIVEKVVNVCSLVLYETKKSAVMTAFRQELFQESEKTHT